MKKTDLLTDGISISPSLTPTLEAENFEPRKKENKKRLLLISVIAFGVAIAVSLIAKFLVHLIDLITNISFYGNFSFTHSSPAANSLGFYVILIPAIGGGIVGLMAIFGSKAIRGHGIPEAMEQILTNQSIIKPTITYLKPLSSAIAIGTGGPFGAEGPIIATGGALGSTIGQVLKISHNERKILLAAGATAGMAAIFGSPVAAIFLAIELLLFEFSPRSFIPVALACITGAAGHHLLFGESVVFPMPMNLPTATGYALFFYSMMGIVIGLLSIVATKIVYGIEDVFDKLPVHWAWWPAIGGLAVGVIGYYEPRTLGVGYNNITDILSGTMPATLVLSLCVLKFTSWSISLGSGTSGGTLAPLLTIGGAMGALAGTAGLQWFPEAGISIPLSALVGMSAMFAGASRAFLTSIIFALETTGQVNAFLPLLATCTSAYFVSYFLMDNTIMTEKIARRGIKTPLSYEPDILERITVERVVNYNGVIMSEENSIEEACEWLDNETTYKSNYFIVSDNDGEYQGIISSSNLYSEHHAKEEKLKTLIKKNSVFVKLNHSLRTTAEIMANENVDVLPVISGENKSIVGLVSYRDILAAYKLEADELEKKQPYISLKRKGMKILMRGQKLIELTKRKNKS
ncbi:MAG: Chloride channel protein [Cytophagales bacterium]|jgi:H+/Cl- antiporter ClcA|nr:chloride channel protein [Bacteroidota bacterium]MBS1982071.1 chloride channel protein [Bacteroidota bacterium]WHZ06458.1 MAG: Chloride channel protein [Cytophagales bacterium]